jgi:mannose-6-phosphate isomerase-like protein (cupin superfamily)
MSATYNLTPHETVSVRTHTPDLLEVEGNWSAHGSAPPPHFHPGQDESFEVLEGELTAVVDGEERVLAAGDTLEVPRGAVHKMWNSGGGTTRAIWRTLPAGRTLEWWQALDGLNGRHGGKPSLPRMAALLAEYDDVIRLAMGPRPIVGPVMAGLAAVGRRQGT